jgi:hypothetical protein
MEKLIVNSNTAVRIQTSKGENVNHYTVMKDRGSTALNLAYAKEKYLGKKFWIAEPTVNIFNDTTQVHVIDYPSVLNPKPKGFRTYTVPSKGSHRYHDDKHRFEVEVAGVEVEPVGRFDRVANVILNLKIILKKDIDYVKEHRYP